MTIHQINTKEQIKKNKNEKSEGIIITNHSTSTSNELARGIVTGLHYRNRIAIKQKHPYKYNQAFKPFIPTIVTHTPYSHSKHSHSFISLKSQHALIDLDYT